MSSTEADENLRFWKAVHNVLNQAAHALPYASEPDRIHWDHPDEDWKNEAAIEAIEDECYTETDALIRHYCKNQTWPKRSQNNARYFAEKRIRWGVRFLRVFTIPISENGRAAIPRPPQSGWDLFEWLLIDAYTKRHPPSPSAPFSISGPDINPPSQR